MSNQPDPDPTDQTLGDLEQPLQELPTEAAEEVSGGMKYIRRSKTSEAPLNSDDDSTDRISLAP